MSAPLPFEFVSESPPAARPKPLTLVITVVHVQYVCDRHYNVWIRSVYLQCDISFGFTKTTFIMLLLTLFLNPTTSRFTTKSQEGTMVTIGKHTKQNGDTWQRQPPGRYGFSDEAGPPCPHRLLRWRVVSLCCVASRSFSDKKHPTRHATRVIPVFS